MRLIIRKISDTDTDIDADTVENSAQVLTLEPVPHIDPSQNSQILFHLVQPPHRQAAALTSALVLFNINTTLLYDSFVKPREV